MNVNARSRATVPRSLDRALGQGDACLIGCLSKFGHERVVVGEDDYLTVPRQLRQSSGYLPSPDVVERTHRIIKDKSCTGGVQMCLGEEAGQTERRLLPLAQYPWDGYVLSCADERRAVAELTLLTSDILEGDPVEVEPIGFTGEPVANDRRDVFAHELGRLPRDARRVRGSTDLVEPVQLHATADFPGDVLSQIAQL